MESKTNSIQSEYEKKLRKLLNAQHQAEEQINRYYWLEKDLEIKIRDAKEEAEEKAEKKYNFIYKNHYMEKLQEIREEDEEAIKKDKRLLLLIVLLSSSLNIILIGLIFFL